MSIIDIKKDVIDYTKWNASTYHNANPDTFCEEKIYDFSVYNLKVEPTVAAIHVKPTLRVSTFKTIENQTSQSQFKEVSFTENVKNTYTTYTKEGFLLQNSITKIHSFPISLTFDIYTVKPKINVHVPGEYHYSSLDPITMTRERLWELTSVISIPPKTKVTATLMVYKGTFIVPIRLHATIRGTYAYNGRYYTNSVQYADWFQKKHIAFHTASSLFFDRDQWSAYKTMYASASKDDDSLHINGSGINKVTCCLYAIIHFEEKSLFIIKW
ncbi:ETX/MTX2 family pore-forming toxin [Bacillus paranthracis]|uniref:ETX/MTX2 family pore-forming toxin n=1 Tax=Bacillus paranthracis TaxID=2026186 RepID=A0AAJ1NNJ1_9BACI|nr:ETX/MTX2 family pore-forming toxin [Bacillus paranthracis]MDG0949894.1 ETX/MTX2 family pore-forming toxin [Bacillus paranthracis]MDG0955683.1 ETX/MTX2 family pore-forming toxin [Bacillus paranthracis]